MTAFKSTDGRQIDIRDLSLAWGQREFLSHADLHLQANSHYVLVGRNGTGKSSVMAALARGSIPGIPSSVRIVFIGQGGLDLDDEHAATRGPSKTSVLDSVVKSDKHREQLLADHQALSAASEQSSSPLALPRLHRKLKLRDLRHELSISTQVATYRSGARGFKARKELKVLETNVQEAVAAVDEAEDQIAPEIVAFETSAAIERLADVDARLGAIDSETAEFRATKILRGLGFRDPMITGPVSNLSGGWQTRCSIACGLFQTSDVLLLDEPTNFLDLPAIIWLKSYINSLTEKTVVVVTHDRDFGDAISSTLLLLKDSAFTVFHGTLSSWMRETRKRTRYMTKLKDSNDRAEQHLKQQIAHNVNAARKSGDDKKLKQAASRKKKLDDRMGLEVGLKGGRFKLNRDLPGYHLKARADIEVPHFQPPPVFSLPDPPLLKGTGNLVSLEDVSFCYAGATKPLLRGVNLAIGPRDRIGLIGLNGAGKSTLIRLILGPEFDPAAGLSPPKGIVQRHPRLRIGCFSQHSVEALERKSAANQSLTALQEILSAGRNDDLAEPQARALLGGLGINGRLASEVPVQALSGGQKVRVALAALLVVPPQVLVLDEVTCHLDADSVAALAGALAGYSGAVVVVSHDRYFVRRVVEGAEARAVDGEESSEDDEDSTDAEGVGMIGARKVLLVEKGTVQVLADGVQQYEAACEKKIRKLQ